MGEAKIFLKHCETNILHYNSALNCFFQCLQGYDRLKGDLKEVKFLKKSITDLTEQLIAARNQLHELTGKKPNESKSSRAIEFYKNDPGLVRIEYILRAVTVGDFIASCVCRGQGAETGAYHSM